MGRVTIQAWKCERCDHVWTPRESEKPKVCPKCKSPYWDMPRKKRMIKRDISRDN